VRTDSQVNFGWTLNSPGRGIPFDWYSVRWTGRVVAPRTIGALQLGVEGNDGYRLYVDDKLVIDDWQKRSYSTTLVPVTFAAGSAHDIRLELFEPAGNARVKLVWDAFPRDDWSPAIDSAVLAARAADVAVIVAGIEEGEFRDRAKLGLPARQEELIDRVAATGKPVVVVLVGGSAITMPWLSKVSAVVDVWYPGEVGGTAVADVLFGDYNPAGRLPITFPVSEGQLPLIYNHKPTGRGDDYLDLTGQPLFPFGFGLSYTSFAVSDLHLDRTSVHASQSVNATMKVTNTGTVAGDDVAQLYLHDPVASISQPVRRLRGFERVTLAPGASTTVRFTIDRSDYGFYDNRGKFVVEPGQIDLYAGDSSAASLTQSFTVTG
jgi:beta-glucosidase